MKKPLLLFVILTLTMLGLAQTQTQPGYVKTLGRPEKKGKALSGVTIRVRGEHNPVVSNDDGTFSLLMTDKKNGDAYTLQQVQKNGYELNENDIIGRQFAFSDKVPLSIVMVSSEQLQADKQRIENNAYKTAEKNYNAKFNLLEKQLSDNQITAEQYRKEIKDLQDKFEKYQSLIDGLAEHYAHTDYDELDEKDREINIHIENGDLERADSLIRLLFDPIGVLERNMEALADIERKMGQAQDIIDQANADMKAILKQQEKDAEYLYQLYTIALARFDNDKALQYIETRAELDPTRWEWQFEAGGYCFNQNLIDKAETYYERVLDILADLISEFLNSYNIDTANEDNMVQNIGWVTMSFVTKNNLAIIYSKTHRLAESEELYLEVINYFKDFFQIHPEDMLEKTSLGQCLASAQMGLSELYRKTNRLEESEALSQEGLKIIQQLNSDNVLYMEEQEAKALMSQGLTYKNQHKFKKSEECYRQALEIHRRITKTNPDNEVEVARTLHNYGNLCSDMKNYDESEAMLLESMEIFRRWANRNPQVYEIKLASITSDLANLYQNAGRFEESEKLFQEALKIERRLMATNPELSEPNLALTLGNFGRLYLVQSDSYSKAIPLLEEAFEIYQRLAQTAPEVYGEKLCISKYNLANVYYKSGQIKESLPFLVEILDEFDELDKDDEQIRETYESTIDFVKELAPWLENQAADFKDEKLFEESEIYYKSALDIYRWLAKSDPKTYESEMAGTLNSLGILYGNIKQFSESETAFNESLEIYQHLAKANPKTYQPEVFRIKNNLAALEVNKAQDYRDKKQYQEAATCYVKVIEIRKELAKEDQVTNYNYVSEIAITFNSLAIVYVNLERYQESETAFKKSLEIYQRLSQTDAARYESLLTQALNNLSSLAFQLKKKTNQNKEEQRYSENEALLSQALEIYRFLNQNGIKKYDSEIIETLGSLSYHCLFNGHWKEAEQTAREAISLDASQQWLFTNLAAALLFQGKYAEAEQIYRQYKDKLRDGFLQNFDDLEAAGIIPKERKADVERIRKMLTEE